MAIQTSYPLFESGQVLTATHLNDTIAYLEQQDRLTRNKLIGIGIACGLEVSSEQSGSRIRIGGGVAISSEGYLLVHAETLYSHFRIYTLPTPQVEEAPDILVDEQPYPFFHNAAGNQISLWELLPVGFTPNPGEPLPAALSATFLQNKVALLFLERNLEALKNCDIGDCSDKGAEWEFTLRVLLVGRNDAQAILDQEQQIAQVPVDRRNHPRYDLGELQIEKINSAAHGIESFEMLLARIFSIATTVAPQLIDALNKSYLAFRYLLEDSYPAASFPQGPFENIYFLRMLTQFIRNIFLGQYFYAGLVDLVRSYNEFLRAAMRIEAECCPHPGRFPLHILLGEVIAQPVAIRADATQANFNPLSINSGLGAATRPAALRHHFIPSPLFETYPDRVQEVRSLHYRTYLLALRFTTDGLMDRAIRLTPSKDGDVQLSDQAIPYYYALMQSKESDDLARNWAYDKTVRNRLDRVFSYQYIAQATHPLRMRMDDHNFYRVEGAVGKALGDVMRTLLEQKRALGLSFAIEPVYIGLTFGDDLTSKALDTATRQRAQQALLKLLICRMRDLDVVFLILMSALFQYMMAIIAALTRINTQLLAGQSGSGGGGGIGIVTPISRLVPKRAQAFRRTSEDLLKELRPQPYIKGVITTKVLTTNDPRKSVGKFYLDIKEAASTANLYDSTLAYVRELKIEGDPEATTRRIYPAISLLDKTEELAKSVSVSSLAEFDFQAFETRYDGFVQSFEDYLDLVQAQPGEPDSPIAQAHEAVAINYTAIAASTPQSVLTGLTAQLNERLSSIFQELLLGGYAQRHPGMEHKGGVPEGGTLVLLYTHRNFLARVVSEHAPTYNQRINAVHTSYVGTTSATGIPNPFDTLIARQTTEDALADFVVLADFCLPYMCCDTDCSDFEATPRQREPAVVRGRVFGIQAAADQAVAIRTAQISVTNLDTNEIVNVDTRTGEFAFTGQPGSYRIDVKATRSFQPTGRIITIGSAETYNEDFVLQPTTPVRKAK
jgi:hypothetical protein